MSIAILAVLHVLVAQPVAAAPSPAPRVAQASPAADTDSADTDSRDLDARRARLRERIHAMRAWRLTRALELDEATAARLFPLLERHDAELAAARRQAAEHRRALRRAVKSGASDAELERLLDALVALHDKSARLEQRRFAAVRKLLTPEQAARALILLPRLDRQLQRALRSGPKPHRRGGKGHGKRRRGEHRRDRGGPMNPFAR